MSENKKIVTPLGKELELKPFLTAREYRQIRSVYVEAMKTTVTDGAVTPVADFNGAVVDQAEDRLIQATVVSYDGSAENILERILQSPLEESNFIIESCNKVVAGNLDKTK